MAPLERRALAGWRQRAWAEVPETGLGLEIGAGTGANFPYYPKGARAAATDVSIRMLRRVKTKPMPAGTALAACDVQELPFRDGTFDWVVATLVFCEVPDPARGLQELRRVLKLHGRLVMLEHVRPAGWLGRMADVATLVTGPTWGEHFDRDTAGLVRAAGFEIEAEERLWRDAVVLLVARRPRAAA